MCLYCMYWEIAIDSEADAVPLSVRMLTRRTSSRCVLLCAAAGSGGGMLISSTEYTHDVLLSVNNCTFAGNNAGAYGFGGGLSIAVMASVLTSITLGNSIFHSNLAGVLLFVDCLLACLLD